MKNGEKLKLFVNIQKKIGLNIYLYSGSDRNSANISVVTNNEQPKEDQNYTISYD